VGERGEGVYDQSARSWEKLDQEPAGGSSHGHEFGMVGTWRRSCFSAMDRAERSEMELFLFGAPEYWPYWIMRRRGQHNFFILDISACFIGWSG
jgi:hypothetical protein